MAVPGNLIEAVHVQWWDLTDVEIDRDAMTRHDERGAWVCAWLLAQPASVPLDPGQFGDALGALPLMAREVYRLHRIEGQSLAETGRQLGLDQAATEAQLFEALRGLHERLYPRR
jgi:DNA-directed RNA polymerase specialized sigma24 family protein